MDVQGHAELVDCDGAFRTCYDLKYLQPVSFVCDVVDSSVEGIRESTRKICQEILYVGWL